MFKITFGCRWRADADSFIGKPDGETILVGFAEYGNGAYVQLFRRTNDADGNFTAIGYQKLVKHACGSRGVDEQDGLSWLDRRLVIDEKARDLAAGVGMDLGKLLHHFDQSDDVSLRYPIAVPPCKVAFRATAADKRFLAADLTPDAAPFV